MKFRRQVGRARPVATLMMLIAGMAQTAPLAAAQVGEEAAYQRCLSDITLNPNQAFDEALIWRDQGGGIPARHCAALALIALEEYAAAAERLEELADQSATRAAAQAMRPDMLGQAGNAWLLADRPDRAYSALSGALALLPETAPARADLLIDRARALAAQEQWAAAEADLSASLSLAPERVAGYIFRATARRFLEQFDAALEDIDTALALDPERTEALLERGILHRLAGRDDAARRDWLKLLTMTEEGPAATAAQRNLEMMDVDLSKDGHGDGAAAAGHAR